MKIEHRTPDPPRRTTANSDFVTRTRDSRDGCPTTNGDFVTSGTGVERKLRRTGVSPVRRGFSEEKKAFVGKKFSSITPRYDFLNSLLSLNIDRYWRWVTARQLDDYDRAPILDLCAGTLPLSLSIARRKPERYILALDLCRDMLAYGRSRLNGQKTDGQIILTCADGEEIPCRDNTFSGITVAFGVRNLSNLDKGLKEMWRVLRPGGKLVILEFSRPHNPIIRPLYLFYLVHILPCIGGWISGDEEAYRYLANSICLFYLPEELAQKMKITGYIKVTYRPLTAGIVTLYTGEKP